MTLYFIYIYIQFRENKICCQTLSDRPISCNVSVDTGTIMVTSGLTANTKTEITAIISYSASNDPD
jgi:hypothetical protein